MAPGVRAWALLRLRKEMAQRVLGAFLLTSTRIITVPLLRSRLRAHDWGDAIDACPAVCSCCDDPHRAATIIAPGSWYGIKARLYLGAHNVMGTRVRCDPDIWYAAGLDVPTFNAAPAPAPLGVLGTPRRAAQHSAPDLPVAEGGSSLFGSSEVSTFSTSPLRKSPPPLQQCCDEAVQLRRLQDGSKAARVHAKQ